MLSSIVAASVFLLQVSSGVHAQTNLPPLGDGIFNVSSRTLIDAPLEAVWEKIIDFASYPDWNPFARSQTVCDEFFIPLKNQTAFEGTRIIISAQIPPLPVPVNRSTPLNLLNNQLSFENVTHLQPDLHRVAWKQIDIPDIAVNVTRWTAVSTVDDQTLYESAQVYNGGLAGIVDILFKEALQEVFDAQGVAVKQLLERGNGTQLS